jgi:hypothetical protein
MLQVALNHKYLTIKIYKMIKIVLTSFIVMIISISDISAQVPNIKLSYGIIAKDYQDSIVLRWAPKNTNILPAHISGGVWIDRLIVSGKAPYKKSEWQRINQVPIKPQPLESFNNEESMSNENVMLVAQLCYGNIPMSIAKDEITRVNDASNVLKSLFSITLLACDISPKAADKMGLRLVLRDKIKNGEKHFFRMYSAYEHPLFDLDTSMTFVTYGEFEIEQTPTFLTAVSKEKSIELHWPFNKNLKRWSAFNIEKSSDGEYFIRLNKKPYIIMTDDRNIDMTYRDSVANYVNYYYRIQAIDPFGDLSGYSEIIEAHGSDKTSPSSLTLVGRSENNDRFHLQWKFDNGKPDGDLKHFIIKQGNAIDHVSDTIINLTKDTYQYTVNKKASTRSTYYEVHAVDTAGNFTASNPVRYFKYDSDPPLPPKEFKAKVDTNGIVSLTWALDTLDELIGYRVYRKNSADHKFVCLQAGYLADTIYHDTLNLKTLTDEIYYAVSAVDLSYNHGKMTDPVKLLKPDILPPYPPNIVDYKVSDGKVYMKWTPSPSDDVVSYSIKRKNLSSHQVTDVKKGISASESNFTDENLMHGEMYEYTIIAIDEVGLQSEASFPLTIKAYTNKVIDNLVLKYLNENDQSGFEWNIPKDKPLYYVIYKDNGNGLQQYANAHANDTKYVEKNNSSAKNYGIQAIYPNQVKSEVFSLFK